MGIDNDFRNFSTDEIEKLFKKMKFNTKKIQNFINAFRTQDIQHITSLKGIRGLDKISESLPFQQLSLVKSLKDVNNNEKFLFRTHDNYYIESVLMPNKKSISICVSSQIGCKFGCTFCNTARMGFIRDLYPFEILDQIRQINIKRILPDRLMCISFMGMGEPFDNLPNCMKAFEWCISKWGFNLGKQKITFSTSGVIPFKTFLSYQTLPNLAVSLHSANENVRQKIMPYARISLDRLKDDMMLYTKKFGKHISIEYCLLKGINDSKEDAILLSEYLSGLPCKVNLLNYNETKNSEFKSVSDNDVITFKEHLKKQNLIALYRRSLGKDIMAGCGQLGETYWE